jgi:hypothetical protein
VREVNDEVKERKKNVTADGQEEDIEDEGLKHPETKYPFIKCP